MNRKHLVQGITDLPLNDEGICQANNLANRLQRKGISEIISSDLKRAFQTANIIAEKIGCGVTTSQDLREQNYGEIEAATTAEVRTRFPDTCRILDDISHPQTNTLSFPKAESRSDVFVRASQVLEDAAMRTPQATIGISTHGGVILSLMSHYFKKMAHIGNADFIVLEYDGKSFTAYQMHVTP